VPRMTLGPRGGHQCWKCEMRAQIDAHGTRPDNAVVRGLRPRRLRPHLLLALSLVLLAATLGLAWIGWVVTTLKF